MGRIATAAMALVAALVGIAPAAPLAAAAVEAVIRPVAGGLGAGTATNVAQTPRAITIANGRMYVVDGFGGELPPIGVGYRGAVWAVDLATGRQDVVAGSDFYQFAGDGGPAVGAHFANVSDVAVSPDGAVFIADTGNERVRKVSPSGVVTTYAGTGAYTTSGLSPSTGDGGLATKASLSTVTDLALAPNGDLYLVDEGRLRRIDGAGVITAITPVPATAQEPSLGRVGDIAFDAVGNLYLAEPDNYRVRKVTSAGVMTTVAGTGRMPNSIRDGEGGPAAAAAVYAHAVAPAPDGALYIAGAFGVRKVDPAGLITTVAGEDYYGYDGDGGPAVDAEFDSIWDLAVDPAGDLYIADYFNNRIRKVDGEGVVTTVAGNGYRRYGGDGGPALDAQFRYPDQVAVGPEGLTVADLGNENVRRVGPDGRTATILTGDLLDMVRDNQGNVYVSDAHRVRKVTPAGDVTEAAPVGGPLAVDGGGSLFVFDGEADAILRVDPRGVVTTAVPNHPGYHSPEEESTAQTTALANPQRMTVGPDGSLWWIEYGRIRKMTCGVVTSYSIAVNSAWSPTGIVIDGTGAAYVSTVDRIMRVDPHSGAITTVIGGGATADYAGQPAAEAKLTFVNGLAIDSDGRLLFSDRTRVWSVAGVVAPARPAGKVCDQLPDRVVRTWGWDGAGLRGDGTTDHYDDLTPPNLVPGAVAVAAGGFHNLALRSDGTVWAWGWNAFGQLGDGTTTDRSTPVQVKGLTGVKAIAAGAYHSLAVLSDGTVRAWGWNVAGELGTGNAVDAWLPVAVKGLGGVVGVSGGGFHSLALKGDGTVWAWGWNALGQLGDGTRVDRSTPVRVVGSADVVGISAGAYHSLAVVRSGLVGAWGWNGVGQLGDGTTVDRVAPVAVVGLHDVKTVAAGGIHSVALSADGTVRAWGWNALGQVGDDTLTDRLTPVPVLNLPPATAIAAGSYHSLAVAAGRAYGWGYNEDGEAMELATPGWHGVLMPVPIGGMAAVVSVAAGAFHSLGVWDYRDK